MNKDVALALRNARYNPEKVELDSEEVRTRLFARYGRFWAIERRAAVNPREITTRNGTFTKADAYLHCLRPALVPGPVLVIQGSANKSWSTGRVLCLPGTRGKAILTKLVVWPGKKGRLLSYRVTANQRVRLCRLDVRYSMARWALRMIEDNKVTQLKRELEKLVSEKLGEAEEESCQNE